jgi:predicted TIM-barrel fold metal-dependent hydrolase
MISNQFVREVCQRFSQQLIGFVSVDPRQGKAALAELETAITQWGFRGLKLHPRQQNLTLSHLREIIELVDAAHSLRVPVVVDAFYYGASFYRNDSLQIIAAVSDALPKARLVIAHLGGVKVLEALLIAKENPNLFMDLSFSPSYFAGSSVEQDLGFAVRKLGPHRLLFGSDHPQVGIRESLDQVQQILDAAGFSGCDKDLVLGLNAQRLFGLPMP